MRELSGKSECRGRNGWFRAKHVNTWIRSRILALPDGTSTVHDSTLVVVEVTSKQLGDNPPIQLWLTIEDAKAVVGVVTNAIIDAGGFQSGEVL